MHRPRISPRNRAFGWIGFALLLAALFFARRWHQFFAPNVYAEDGMIVLPDALAIGWEALFAPVQGYLVLTTRFFGSLSLLPEGLAGYPFWGSVFSGLFGVFVLLYIAATPSLLPCRRWLALAAALVPTGPEVFCLPYTAFWWAGLLLMALVLRADHDSRGLSAADLSLAAVCGLSGVIAPLAAAVLAVRVFCFRDRFRGAIPLLAVTAAAACVQAAVFLIHGRGTAGETSIGGILRGYGAEPLQNLSRFIRRFFGEFVLPGVPDGVGPQALLALAGIGLIAFLAVAQWRTRNPLFLYLWLFTLGSLALAAIRVDFTLMEPLQSSPRYFFYPWVLLSWMLIALLALSRAAAVRAICAIALLSAGTGLVRGLRVPAPDDLGWRRAVEELHETGSARLPVHVDGRAESSWEIPLIYRNGTYARPRPGRQGV